MKTITTALTAFMLLCSIFIFGQAGRIDSSFGKDGKVITNIDGEDFGYSVAIQANWKIVVAGTLNSDFGLVRYQTNGLLDKHFGNGGIVTTDFGSTDDCFSMAIQPDKKIVAVGRTGFSNYANAAIARYQSNGLPDSSFGTNGKLIIDFTNGDYDYASSVAIQEDGKIVVSIVAAADTNYNFALLRLNRNGKLDNSFGNHGKVITDFSASTDEYTEAVTIQPGGQIIAAGLISGNTMQDFALAGYNPDGTLDSNFGTYGKTTTDFNGQLEYVGSVAVEPNGKIVVAGSSYSNSSDYDIALARYKPNGTLDGNFGTDGKILTDFHNGSSDGASSVAIQGDRKIVVAGYSDNQFALVRYRQNGTIDRGFGINGKVTTTFNDQASANSVVIQTDGKIVAAGTCEKFRYPLSPVEKIAVARYNGDVIPGVNPSGIEQLLSTKPEAASDNLSLYPNPSKGEINISYDCIKEGKVQIKLFDITGRIVLNKNNAAVKGNNIYHLNLSNLAAGIYYAELINNDKKSRVKFVIEK